jgi:hypothetical protein
MRKSYVLLPILFLTLAGAAVRAQTREPDFSPAKPEAPVLATPMALSAFALPPSGPAIGAAVVTPTGSAGLDLHTPDPDPFHQRLEAVGRFLNSWTALGDVAPCGAPRTAADCMDAPPKFPRGSL